ncbi:hypothetical protein ABKU49_23190, partial [Enterobacter hormaechei]
FVVGGPVGDSELLLCHGMVCVVGRMRDLILQLSKSSIYSTKPLRHGVHSVAHRGQVAGCSGQLKNYDCVRSHKSIFRSHFPYNFHNGFFRPVTIIPA